MFMNLSAPSIVKSDHLTAAMHTMQYELGDDERAVSRCLLPVFSYTKNGLWGESTAVMKHIAGTGCHCDRSFYLQVKVKCDGASYTEEPLTGIITCWFHDSCFGLLSI